MSSLKWPITICFMLAIPFPLLVHLSHIASYLSMLPTGASGSGSGNVSSRKRVARGSQAEEIQEEPSIQTSTRKRSAIRKPAAKPPTVRKEVN